MIYEQEERLPAICSVPPSSAYSPSFLLPLGSLAGEHSLIKWWKWASTKALRGFFNQQESRLQEKRLIWNLSLKIFLGLVDWNASVCLFHPLICAYITWVIIEVPAMDQALCWEWRRNSYYNHWDFRIFNKVRKVTKQFWKLKCTYEFF